MSVIRITKKFSSILSGHQKLRIAELIILMVAGGFLEMCSVSLVIPFMNAVMNPEKIMKKWYVKLICDLLDLHSPRTFLVVVAIALAVVYILKNIYLLFEFNIQYRFVYGNMFAMQRQLLDCYIHRPYEFFLKASSSEIIRIVNNDTASTFGMLSTLLSIFTEIVVSGMLIITIFFITPAATACMAGILLFLLLIINWFIKPILARAGVANQKSAAGMNKWLLQSIEGIKDVKITGKEEYFVNNYDFYGSTYVNVLRKNGILGMTPRFFIEAISMGAMFLVVAFLIYKGNDLDAIIPILTAVAMAAIRLLPSVNRISSGLASIAYSEPMLDKLIENLRAISDSDQVSLAGNIVNETEDRKEADIHPIRREIRFDHVTFHYPTAEANVLSDASMTIRYGESVGIVGSSGAGKTTAVDILLGLLKPQEGHVFVDDVDILRDVRGWHDQIGYIPQMIFMLDDTIKHNICFGVAEEDISESDMWKALEEASLSDFVKSLPDGVETEIGERGVRLSGGQRQRIGIARALYRNPSILVFDEATSALDNETESAIMESIHSLHGQKTMIIIAHRLSTIEGCDAVYRVENGKIQLEGK